MRTVLVALLVASTVGFVIGTTVERNQSAQQAAAPASTHEGVATENPAEQANEAASTEGTSESGAGASEAAHVEASEESRPFGIDIEAVPFIVLAALGTLALAALVWVRPHWLLALSATVAAMALFAALDVRDVIHQADESRSGLAVLAGLVAALHIAAGIVAALMIGRIRRSPRAPRSRSVRGC